MFSFTESTAHDRSFIFLRRCSGHRTRHRRRSCRVGLRARAHGRPLRRGQRARRARSDRGPRAVAAAVRRKRQRSRHRAGADHVRRIRACSSSCHATRRLASTKAASFRRSSASCPRCSTCWTERFAARQSQTFLSQHEDTGTQRRTEKTQAFLCGQRKRAPWQPPPSRPMARRKDTRTEIQDARVAGRLVFLFARPRELAAKRPTKAAAARASVLKLSSLRLRGSASVLLLRYDPGA